MNHSHQSNVAPESTHHVCYGGVLACSGANPCPSCHNVVNENVLAAAMLQTTEALMQARGEGGVISLHELDTRYGATFWLLFNDFYAKAWATLHVNMMNDPEVARRAFDLRAIQYGALPQTPTHRTSLEDSTRTVGPAQYGALPHGAPPQAPPAAPIGAPPQYAPAPYPATHDSTPYPHLAPRPSPPAPQAAPPFRYDAEIRNEAPAPVHVEMATPPRTVGVSGDFPLPLSTEGMRLQRAATHTGEPVTVTADGVPVALGSPIPPGAEVVAHIGAVQPVGSALFDEDDDAAPLTGPADIRRAITAADIAAGATPLEAIPAGAMNGAGASATP